LSAIAQRYYKSGAREKWMLIYEANKEVIGDNPSLIKVGQVLKIPKL
jgi:nucleoid-associated protein YgaU